jgi:hypothetical protein
VRIDGDGGDSIPGQPDSGAITEVIPPNVFDLEPRAPLRRSPAPRSCWAAILLGKLVQCCDRGAVAGLALKCIGKPRASLGGPADLRQRSGKQNPGPCTTVEGASSGERKRSLSRSPTPQQTLAVQLVRLVVRINPRTLREQGQGVTESALVEHSTRLLEDRPAKVIRIFHARVPPAQRLCPSGASREVRAFASPVASSRLVACMGLLARDHGAARD